MSTVLTTTRLVLRSVRGSDAQRLYPLRESEYVLRYNALGHVSLEKWQADVARWRQDENVYCLALREDDSPIGLLHIEEDDLRWKVQALSLNYWLGEEYAGHGYMTEAIRAVVARLFSHLKADVVSGRCFAPNTASRRVLEKAGFRLEGCLKMAVRGYGDIVYDDCLYAITRKEWTARKPGNEDGKNMSNQGGAGLRLLPLSPEIAEAAYECMQDLPNENGFGNGGYGLTYEAFVSEFLPHCERYAKGIGLKPEHVPQAYYILFEDDRAVGVFKFRHYLNDFLRSGAGHIGYGVRRSDRGRGLAKAGLALLLDVARNMIEEDEAYLSVNKNNPASLHVMLANGAYIHHEDAEEYYTRIPLHKN